MTLVQRSEEEKEDEEEEQGLYLEHGSCWDEHRVSQELDDGPALDVVLVQQPLALLPAQVGALLPDRVLLQRHVQTLLLVELLEEVVSGRTERTPSANSPLQLDHNTPTITVLSAL